MKHGPSHLGANLSPFFIGESISSSDGELIDSSDDEESSELLMLAILSMEEKRQKRQCTTSENTFSVLK